MKLRLTLLLGLIAVVAFAENVVITNPKNQPVTMRVVGFAKAPTPSGSPVATPTATATSTPTPTPTPSAFNPASIAGLDAWFKADAITGVADGSRVASWPDSSASGNNATNASGPLYYSNQLRAVKDALAHADQGINTLEDDFIINSLPENIRGENIPGQMLVNKPAVVYDGLAAMTLATPITTGGTVICLIQNNLYYTMAGLASDDGLSGGTLRSPSGPTYAYNRMVSNGTVGYWGDQTLTAQQWYVITMDTTGAIRINGVTYPVPYGGVQAGGGPFTSVGSATGGGGAERGWVAEVLHYNSVLSTTDRQNVEAYLKSKYGL